MISTIRGPAVFLAQFIGADTRRATLEGLCDWASETGFKALQVPTFFPEIFDVSIAAASQDYCDTFLGTLAAHGLQLAELTSQRQGHLLAIHPAYDLSVDPLAPNALRGNPSARQAWAAEQLRMTACASRMLGLDRFVTFSGSLLWPYLYPYPPVPSELVNAGFKELARRWRPILNAADAEGVDVCFELHPTEDLHDGSTFERFLDATDGHPRVRLLYDPSHLHLQHMDYLGFIDAYGPYIRAFHVKDAEFLRSARTGVYGGYNDWRGRAGRFRSPGDGQIDFRAVFSRLTAQGFDGWATLEWECCFKNRDDGAREGCSLIRDLIIRVTDQSFDATIRYRLSDSKIRKVLGLPDED